MPVRKARPAAVATTEGTTGDPTKAMTKAGTQPNFWVAVVSRNHVARGIAGSFAQVNHGKAGPLERMRAGDGFVYYSPRTDYPDGPPLQAFTAIGRVRDGIVYQADVATDGNAGPATDAAPAFRPYRLAIDYFNSGEAAIKPLLADLSFIRSKTHWGAAFRFGVVRVPPDDFARIAQAMGRDFGADFPGVAKPQAMIAG